MAEESRYDAFLSHNSTDAEAVELIARHLREEAHLAPFLDRWHLVPGEPWQEALEEALDASRACAVFLGPGGLGTWENEEMRAALDIRVDRPGFRVIPVLLPGARLPERGRLPRFLARLTWVDFRPGLDDADAFHRLVCGIQGVAPGPEGAVEAEAVCPFRGLQVFDEEHAPFFFGREALTQHLGEQLRGDRFLAVLGPSGGGKSSLVRAGLVPQVRGGALPASDRWPIVLFKPGPHPLETLAARLVPHLDGSSDPLAARQSLLDALAKDERGLHGAVQVALAAAPDSQRLLLIVDQFEELFTLCRDEGARASFTANLLYASAIAGGQTVAVVTMRADFFGKCAAYPELAARLAERDVLVGPMGEDDLCRAMEGPAEAVGLHYEKGLVETILGDLGNEPGMLPLLQHTLLELWERRRGGWLTTDAYHEIGGVQGALAQRADEIYEGLTAEQQVAARRVLLRLTQPGEGTEDTRRRATMVELLPAEGGAEDVEAAVGKLADARLLATDKDEAGEEVVDVAHEALIRGWPRLQEWIDEDRAALRTHRRLTEAAGEWNRNERDESYLYRGARLTEAEVWAEAHAGDLNPLEQVFLTISVSAHKRTQRQRIIAGLAGVLLVVGGAVLFGLFRNRAAREQEALADARATAVVVADTERDAARNAEATAQAEAAARATAVVDANTQRAEAERQSRIAQARELAARSADALEGDVELSLLLAAEAVNVTYDVDGTFAPEAEVALYRALALSSFRGTLGGHTGRIHSVSFSPDGTRILTVGCDEMDAHGLSCQASTARLWDAQGDLIAVLEGQKRKIDWAGFSPDGARIVTVSDYGTRVWDTQGNLIAKLKGVWSPSFSPDGTRIVTVEGVLAQVRDSEGGLIATLEGHADMIRSASFSLDGRRIVTASDDTTARVWNAGGSPLATLEGYTFRCDSASFSPDGSRILTTGCDRPSILGTCVSGAARLWSMEGNLIATLGGDESLVNFASFSPDGTRIVTGSCDDVDDSGICGGTTVQVWDQDGNLVTAFGGRTRWVTSVSFSPDGSRLVTVGCDDVDTFTDICVAGVARVWDLEGNLIAALEGHAGIVTLAGFGPDGTRIVTVSDDGMAWVWDRQGNLLFTVGGYSKPVKSASFSPDGARIVTAGCDKLDDRGTCVAGTAQLWDPNGDLITVLEGHEGWTNSASFSPDGARLVTAGCDIPEFLGCFVGSARVWDAEGHFIAVLDERQSVTWAGFSPDGARIVTMGNGGAQVRDAKGYLIARIDGFRSAGFSPDGTRLVTVGDGDTAQIWDVAGELLATLDGHTDVVQSASFSPDGTRIVTVSDDRTARVWSAAGDLLATLEGDTDAVLSAVFSPDGTRIVTAVCDEVGEFGVCAAGAARVWDLEGNLVTTLEGNVDLVLSAGFSPDGAWIVTAGCDEINEFRVCEGGTARLWDAAGNLIAVLAGHKGQVEFASFNPAGTRIVTASCDEITGRGVCVAGTMRVWDAAGNFLTTLEGHTSAVWSAEFSADGARLLTVGCDTLNTGDALGSGYCGVSTARLWEVWSDIDAMLAEATRRAGRTLTDAECRQHLHVEKCP